MTVTQLGSDAAIAELVQGLTGAVAFRPSSGLAIPGEADDLAVFESEAQWRAAYLASLADREGGDRWCFRALAAESGPWDFLETTSSSAELAGAVCGSLAQAGRLRDVLESTSRTDLAALVKTLGYGADAGTLALATENDSVTAIGRVVTTAVGTDELLRSRWIRQLCDRFEPGESVRARWGGRAHQPAEPQRVRAVAGGPGKVPSGRVLPGVGSSGPAAAASSGELATDSPQIDSAPLSTRFGGLFYLLSLAVELDLGELLWRACLPEGAVLTHVAAWLLGPTAAHDPAPEYFGGVAPQLEMPTVLPDHQAEVCQALLASLVGAIPRRGLAEWPEIVLERVTAASGRVLVARGPGPYALFVWPATTVDDVVEGMRVFLASWPVSAPVPHAEPALAQLDRTGRIRSASVRFDLPLSLPSADDVYGLCLLAQLTGTLGFLFAARLRRGVESSLQALVDGYFAHRGGLTWRSDVLIVSLPADAIDPAVRRAGLDRNPGWIPWLDCVVRIEFDLDQ
jgi:hypothetical protein